MKVEGHRDGNYILERCEQTAVHTHPLGRLQAHHTCYGSLCVCVCVCVCG